jgi:hypothetical protein
MTRLQSGQWYMTPCVKVSTGVMGVEQQVGGHVFVPIGLGSSGLCVRLAHTLSVSA